MTLTFVFGRPNTAACQNRKDAFAKRIWDAKQIPRNGRRALLQPSHPLQGKPVKDDKSILTECRRSDDVTVHDDAADALDKHSHTGVRQNTCKLNVFCANLPSSANISASELRYRVFQKMRSIAQLTWASSLHYSISSIRRLRWNVDHRSSMPRCHFETGRELRSML